MQDVGTLSQYIHEFGPVIVILSVFLFLFMVIVGYIVKTNKKSLDSNVELNKQLISSILNEYFEKTKEQKPYDERNIVNIIMELNKTLKSACEKTMRETNSDRTAIYVFHNGSHSSHGLPFVRFTCISETISKNSNINIKIGDHSAITVGTYDSIITGLYDNSEYRINVETTKDPIDLAFLKNTKIKDCFMVPVYDDDNNMMGFVLNGYNEIDNNRNFKIEKEYLIDLAQKAQPVIEYSKVQEYQNKED